VEKGAENPGLTILLSALKRKLLAIAEPASLIVGKLQILPRLPRLAHPSKPS